MLRWFASCLLLLSCSRLPAEPAYRSIQVGENPESVCRGFGGRLYVTLINGEQPGDGSIVSVDDTESAVKSNAGNVSGQTDKDRVAVFAKGFNAPKGLVFTGEYLVAADETTLWKIDGQGTVTKLAEAKDFPRPIEFLNDVVFSSSESAVYVAEMSNPAPMFDPSAERQLWDLESSQAKSLPMKGCVYRVSLKGEVTEAAPPGTSALRFPNGLALETPDDHKSERLLIADFFTGSILTFKDDMYQELTGGMRGLDGLAVTDAAWYGSSWTQGKVWRVDRKTKESRVILDGLKTAADFFLDAPDHQLIVPDMVAGTLTFVPID